MSNRKADKTQSASEQSEESLARLMLEAWLNNASLWFHDDAEQGWQRTQTEHVEHPCTKNEVSS